MKNRTQTDPRNHRPKNPKNHEAPRSRLWIGHVALTALSVIPIASSCKTTSGGGDSTPPSAAQIKDGCQTNNNPFAGNQTGTPNGSNPSFPGFSSTGSTNPFNPFNNQNGTTQNGTTQTATNPTLGTSQAANPNTNPNSTEPVTTATPINLPSTSNGSGTPFVTGSTVCDTTTGNQPTNVQPITGSVQPIATQGIGSGQPVVTQGIGSDNPSTPVAIGPGQFPSPEPIDPNQCGQNGVYCNGNNGSGGNYPWPSAAAGGAPYDQGDVSSCLAGFAQQGYNTNGAWTINVREMTNVSVLSNSVLSDTSTDHALILINAVNVIGSMQLNLLNPNAAYCIKNVSVLDQFAVSSCYGGNVSFGLNVNVLAQNAVAVVNCPGAN